MGLSPSEFWELSWYDWNLLLLRLGEQDLKERNVQETLWFILREQWADYRNAHGEKSRGVDLVRLSFDEKKKETPKMTPEQVERRFGKSLHDKMKFE
jgi:hypothetical protein